jgi:hypothetical protein
MTVRMGRELAQMGAEVVGHPMLAAWREKIASVPRENGDHAARHRRSGAFSRFDQAQGIRRRLEVPLMSIDIF